ncbi:MAG: GTPase domain-containing protein [Verrucomicrobiota bacterium]
MEQVRENTLTLSLISHTNVGKTTLARTLLRKDIGESFDQAHVTDENEKHVLLEAGGKQLILWDTPGFGDSARLLRRLKKSGQKLTWFLAQAWDRIADRALWCSQQAVKNVQEEADVVLYLVNASEEPEAAGYIEIEMEILAWIGKPVLILLNQVGIPKGPEEEAREEREWKVHLAEFPIVKGVLSLDAFTRCWVQEQEVIESTAKVLSGDRKHLADELAEGWWKRNYAIFEKSVGLLGKQLFDSLADRKKVNRVGLKERFSMAKRGEFRDELRDARKDLTERMGKRVVETMNALIDLHGLEGETAKQLEAVSKEQFTEPEQVNETLWSAVGGAVVGAGGGLAADVASGGLSLGGGMILGGVGGGVGAYFLARGFNLAKGSENSVRWSLAHIREQVKLSALSYLAVAHFGRGRGEWKDGHVPEFWGDEVDKAIESEMETIAKIWKSAADDDVPNSLATDASDLFERLVRNVFDSLYPKSMKSS